MKGVRVFNEVVRGSAIFDAEQFPDWDSVIAYWRKNLTGTILSLKAGDAAVRIQDEQDLKYCEVSAILRVAERALQFEHVQKLNVNKVGDVSR